MLRGGVLLGIMIILVTVLFSALLIFGLILCRKYTFTAGFYFFLILIINQISSYIYPPFFNKYIDSLVESHTPLPMSMTIGEILVWFSLLPKIIEVIAFCFLVVGLYRMWKYKKIKKH